MERLPPAWDRRQVHWLRLALRPAVGLQEKVVAARMEHLPPGQDRGEGSRMEPVLLSTAQLREQAAVPPGRAT